MENIEIINGVEIIIDGIWEMCDVPAAVAEAVEKDLRDTVAEYANDFWGYECRQGYFRFESYGESNGVYKSVYTQLYGVDGSSIDGYSIDDFTEYPYKAEPEIWVFVEDDDDGARHVKRIRADAVIRDAPKI